MRVAEESYSTSTQAGTWIKAASPPLETHLARTTRRESPGRRTMKDTHPTVLYTPHSVLRHTIDLGIFLRLARAPASASPRPSLHRLSALCLSPLSDCFPAYRTRSESPASTRLLRLESSLCFPLSLCVFLCCAFRCFSSLSRRPAIHFKLVFPAFLYLMSTRDRTMQDWSVYAVLLGWGR